MHWVAQWIIEKVENQAQAWEDRKVFQITLQSLSEEKTAVVPSSIRC